MSIKPIDLQTLFVKMHEVSKDQALSKEQAALQQERNEKNQVTQDTEKDHRVNQSAEDTEMQHIKDEEKGTQQEQHKEEKSVVTKKERKTKKILKDPNLGQNVDISG